MPEQEWYVERKDEFLKRFFFFLTTPGTGRNRGRSGGAQCPKRLKLSLDAGRDPLGLDSPAEMLPSPALSAGCPLAPGDIHRP